jgi:hypothetical protein
MAAFLDSPQLPNAVSSELLFKNPRKRNRNKHKKNVEPDDIFFSFDVLIVSSFYSRQ